MEDRSKCGFHEILLPKGGNCVQYNEVQRLHKSRNVMPDAVFAGSDEVAVGILLYLHEQDISVPEKIAVISIDNIEIAAYTSPQLTTVNIQKRADSLIAHESCHT